MSSESDVLHVVLVYIPDKHILVAELYNDDNIPNSKLPNPYLINASYTLLKNNVFEDNFIDMSDRIEIPIHFLSCGDEYKIFVEYTANEIAYPYSVASLIISSDYIFGSYVSQKKLPNNLVLLNIVPPINVKPIKIQWAYNYELLKQNNEELIVHENGIYEVAFRCSKTCLAYYSIIEVVNAQIVSYVRIVGNDNNLYGTFGIPKCILEINFIPVNFNSILLNSIYVGKSFVVNDNKCSLTKTNNDSLIYFYTYNTCGIGLEANTFVLPCKSIKKSSREHPTYHPHANPCTHLKYHRPISGRPLPLPKIYKTYFCV